MSGLGVIRSALSSSVRLLLCRSPLAHDTKPLPDSVLPPERGMMFITGPPDSTSPMLPDTVNVTSCAFRVSVR